MLLFHLLHIFLIQGNLDYHIDPGTKLSINLPSVVQTKNYSCIIQGNYNISALNRPAVISGLSLFTSTTKPVSGFTSVLAVFNKTLYASSGYSLVLFNLTNLNDPQSIRQVLYAQGSILGVQPTSGLMGKFLVSVEGNGLFRVLNSTDYQELVDLRVVLNVVNPIYCNFVQDLNYWWAFLYNASNVFVVKFELNRVLASSLYRVLGVMDFEGCSDFLAVNVNKNIFYVCDSTKGVLTYTLSPVIYTLTEKPGFIFNFQHPVLFGKLNSCDMSPSVLTICTDTALLLYQLPFLNVLGMYGGSYLNGKTSGNWVAAYKESRFQIFNLSLTTVQDPIFDGFVDVNYWIFYGNNLLVCDETELRVYSLHNPTISFPSQNVNYVYIGEISCIDQDTPVRVLASYSTGLFEYRGESENSGFLQPTSFQNFTFGTEFRVDIPISNYVSGNNISYTVEIENGTCTVNPFYSILKYYDLPFNKFEYVQIFNLTIVLGNKKSIYAILLNANFTGIYSGYVTQFNSIQSITCLHSFDDKVVYEYIDSQGNNLQELKTIQGHLLYSSNLDSKEPCIKMLISGHTLIIQRAKTIESYNLMSNKVSLIASVNFSEDLTDITLCSNLCALVNASLVQYTLPNLGSMQTLFSFSEPVSQILSSNTFLLAVTSDFIYSFSLPSMSHSLYSTICGQSSYSVSAQFMSSYCEKNYIIDLYSPSFSSVLGGINEVSGFYLDINSSNPSIAVGLNKDKVVLFSIGNNFSSNLLPAKTMISSIWGSVIIPDNFQTLSSKLNIIADNELGTKIKSIEINLVNSYYLELNSSFNPASSQLTSGQINVKSNSFSGLVPVNSYVGNNLTYYLEFDAGAIRSKENCTNNENVCIESKNYKFFTISYKSPVSDFCINNNTIVISSDATLSVYDFSEYNPKFKNSFKFTDSSKKTYKCLNIFLLSDNFSLICSGVYSSSSSIAIYYIISGSIKGDIFETFQINYEPKWLTVSQKAENYVYIYEGVGLYVFQLLLNSTFYLVNYYSTASLGILFSPVSAQYYSENLIIIGDKNKGVCFLSSENLIEIFNPPSNSSVIDVLLLENNILVFTETGEGYLLDYSGTSILNTFYKLYPTGYIPANIQSGVNEELSLVVYPIYTSDDNGFLRVLNYVSGEIYTDISVSQFSPYTHFRKIIVMDKGFPVIIHDLSADSATIPLTFLGIRDEIGVFVKSVKREKNGFLRLLAYVGSNEKSYGKVLVEYQKNEDDSNGGSGSEVVYKKWWFWFSIFGSLTLVFAFLGVAYWWYIRKRKNSHSFGNLLIND